MAGVGRLNYEPHRTLPTVPYGPSWFSGMIEEQAKRQMSSGSRLFYLTWPMKTLLVAVTSMHAFLDKLHAMLSDAFAINTGTPCGAPVDRTALREPFDDLCLWWLTSSRWSSIREPACELDDAGW